MSSFTTTISDELREFWTSSDPFKDDLLGNLETLTIKPTNEYSSAVPESHNDMLPELTSDNILTCLNGSDYQVLTPPLNTLNEVEEWTGKITLCFQLFCIFI